MDTVARGDLYQAGNITNRSWLSYYNTISCVCRSLLSYNHVKVYMHETRILWFCFLSFVAYDIELEILRGILNHDIYFQIINLFTTS